MWSTLALEYGVKHRELANKVHVLPDEVDAKIAELKLKALGLKMDELTEEQKIYLSSWKEGT